MYQANDPNFYTGSDSERIEKALEFAVINGLPLTITARDSQERTHWLIDRAILLPGNTELQIIDCTIQLSDQCRDNFIRSANCICGTDKVQPISNITIRGFGNAVLKGAEHPRSTGDGSIYKTLAADTVNVQGVVTFGTDAGKSDESQHGDWRNIGILLADVSDFCIEGIRIIDSHCWAISMEYCSNGKLRNIDFASTSYVTVDGVSQLVRNQDGIDLRQGCRYIEIGNITGYTGDDIVALTGIGAQDETRLPGSWPNTHFSASKRRGEGDDIHHITIRNIRGFCAGGHHIIRLLNTWGVKMHHVLIQDVEDTSPAGRGAAATLKIGDCNPVWGGPNPLGDTCCITAKNIISNSKCGIKIEGSLAESVFENISLGPNGEKLLSINDPDLIRDVVLP